MRKKLAQCLLTSTLLLSGCFTFDPGRLVDYQPGTSMTPVTSAEEALSIVKGAWDWESPDKFYKKEATPTTLIEIHDYWKSADKMDVFDMLGSAFRGKQTYTCGYQEITHCTIREGASGSPYYVVIHAPVKAPRESSFGTDVFYAIPCKTREKAVQIADALILLANGRPSPSRINEGKPPAPSTPGDPKSKPVDPPREYDPKENPSPLLGHVTGINKRWGLIIIRPITAEHGARPGQKLVCKRAGQKIADLEVTAVSPNELSCRISLAAAIELIQLQDEVHRE